MQIIHYYKHRIHIVVACFLMISSGTAAQNKYFKNWPAGKSPQEIGELVANRFIATPYTNFGFDTLPSSITYSEVCAWYGALKFSKADKSSILTTQLYDRFKPLLLEKQNLIPRADHVDHTVFGALPLEFYIQGKDPKLLAMGKTFADQQWLEPDHAKKSDKEWLALGLTWQTRLWIDDMFMITLVQAQAYRATKDTTYINRAAREMRIYLKELQKPNGLFYHATDVPFYWGRGNGWMAAGMTELLSSLPKNNQDRPEIMRCYKIMMAALLKFQSGNGMWKQLLDDPSSWDETSCTGMFTYAFITGVKNGWLDERVYGPAARKAWLALTSYINSDGNVREICEGTNKLNDRQYYLDRKRITGDMHGQAPVLWCAYMLSSNK
jgi:unsaturated rhamnogalacturonyl hydrolase